jgi:hypothetical protein
MIVPMPKKILILLCLMISGAPAFAKAKAACESPVPPAIPSGRTSTEKVMREALEAVKNFIASGVTYRECLDKEFADVKDKLPDHTRAVLEEAYQDSLETEDLVADTFNTQLRIFKSLHD